MVDRITDWPTALAAFFTDRGAMPFAWGTNDCALFAADAVLAITGHDFAAAANRKYRTARGAAGALKRLGVGDVGELAEKALGLLGAPMVPVAYARRGDVGHGVLEGRATLLVRGGTGWVGPGAEGLVIAAVNPDRAWAVGWAGV